MADPGALNTWKRSLKCVILDLLRFITVLFSVINFFQKGFISCALPTKPHFAISENDPQEVLGFILDCLLVELFINCRNLEAIELLELVFS